VLDSPTFIEKSLPLLVLVWKYPPRRRHRLSGISLKDNRT
jgi:hypothetical protein